MRQPDVLRSGPRRVLVLILALVALVLPASHAETYGATVTGPAFAGDFPDPTVLRMGRTFYAYATNSTGRYLPVLTSLDLQSWRAPVGAEALPHPAVWGVDLSPAGPSKEVWAPGVFTYGHRYIAFYALRMRAESRRTCISVATSSSPTGPFVDRTTKPVLCDRDPLGSIDPQPYVDPATGRAYLTWKSEGEQGVAPTRLWAQQLDAAGTGLRVGAARRLLLTTQLAWEGPIIENPSMVRYGGRWWLLYSGNDWASPRYAVGYARCAGPVGPCTRPSTRPLLASSPAQLGPGGASAFVDAAGRLRMAYHYWPGPTTGYGAACAGCPGPVRRLAVASLHVDRSGHLSVVQR